MILFSSAGVGLGICIFNPHLHPLRGFPMVGTPGSIQLPGLSCEKTVGLVTLFCVCHD